MNRTVKHQTSENNIHMKKTRRDFFKTVWKGLGIIAGVELGGLTIHYLADRQNKKDVNNSSIFEVGFPNEFPKGSVTPFRVGNFYLIHSVDGGFLAISLKCTHLGCSIIWDEKQNQFLCPCHSSKFSILGDVLNTPAPRALDIYIVSVSGGKLFVNLNKKISRDKFEKSQLTFV